MCEMLLQCVESLKSRMSEGRVPEDNLAIAASDGLFILRVDLEIIFSKPWQCGKIVIPLQLICSDADVVSVGRG